MVKVSDCSKDGKKGLHTADCRKDGVQVLKKHTF